MANAQPSRPELNSFCVGGHDAFGSAAWNVGTVQLSVRSPERLEVSVAAEARSISLSAASSPISPDSDVT